ncbi:MAG: hypothetical protein PHW04_00040 [Candidatus Wallbacteria bacterium]|nr:hypothetical protein [Candidatus Wallbacteria bacterium]
MSAEKKDDQVFNANIETVCPSCGRFVGPYDRCPYCGREVYKRLSVKLVKIVALIMAFTGLFFLYLASLNRELPVIKVNEVKPTMNFAYVRVHGIAKSSGMINDYGGLNFTLNDSADGMALDSSIQIKAYTDIANRLKERKLLPEAGDMVDVAGSLKIKEGSVSMIIQSPDQIKIDSRKAEELSLHEINETRINEKIRIHGEIIELIEKPGKAPNEIRIRDESDEGRLEMWKNTYQELAALKGFGVGAQVKADIFVDQYMGKLQLWVKNSKNLTIMVEAPAGSAAETSIELKPEKSFEQTTIATLTESMIKSLVVIEANIENCKILPGPKSPNLITINDGSGSIELVAWKSVYAKLVRNPGFGVGAKIKVSAEIDKYRDNLQLRLNNEDDLQIVSGTAQTLTTEEKKIPEINDSLVGKNVETTGTVSKIEVFGAKQNHKAVLTFASAEIELIFWSANFPELPPQVAKDKKLRVSGRLNKYNDKLQIIIDQDSALEEIP